MGVLSVDKGTIYLIISKYHSRYVDDDSWTEMIQWIMDVSDLYLKLKYIYNIDMKNIDKNFLRVKMDELGLNRINPKNNLVDNESTKQVFNISTSPSTHEIQDILRYIRDEQLVVPEIQRDANAWDSTKKQLFIDSLIYNYPIPPMMILRHKGKKILIDGQQRLSCIMEFVNDGIKTKKTPNMDSTYYSKLDNELKEKFMQRELFFQNIIQKSPDGDDVSVIFDIFTRINTGSAKLSPMEVRFASYYGEFSKFLKKFSIHSIKLETKLSRILKPKNYIDFSEKILRIIFMQSFLVFENNIGVTYGPQKTKKTINLKKSLDFTMEFFSEIKNSPSFFKSKIASIETELENFSDHAFNSWNENSVQTSKIQMPLFDAFVIALGNNMPLHSFNDLPGKIRALTKKDFPKYKELFQVQSLTLKSINNRMRFIFG